MGDTAGGGDSTCGEALRPNSGPNTSTKLTLVHEMMR